MDTKLSKKEQFSENLALFVSKTKYFFITVIAIIVITIAGLGIYDYFHYQNLEKSAIMLEAIEKNIENMLVMEDSTQKTDTMQSILTDISGILDKHPSGYPAARAFFLRGITYYHNEQFIDAAEAYIDAFETAPSSFLASTALFNAAVSYEEEEAYMLALSTLDTLVLHFEASYHDIARVYFSLGRLSEIQGDTGLALQYYQTLEQKYPGSDWTNLAISRIIYLQSM